MTPRPIRSSIGLVLILLLLAPASHVLAGEVIDGTWELNVAKSKFNPGPPFKSQSRTYATDGEMQTVKIDSVSADGQTMSSHSSYRLDGKDYPVLGSNEIDAVAMTKVDSSTAHGVAKRAGKMASSITRTVADDGKTLTVQTKGTGLDGKPFSNVLVFDRK